MFRGHRDLFAALRRLALVVVLTTPAAAQDMWVNSAYFVDVDGNPSAARVGEPLYLRVDFSYFNPTCQNYVLRRSIDGTDVDASPINWGCGYTGLTGWSHVWGVPSPCQAGTHDAMVTLDANNSVSETNEANNTYAFQFNALPAGPDRFTHLLGADAFYNNGFRGEGVTVGILDRGWIDTSGCGMDAPTKVTEFIRWIGSPDPGLNTPTGHETLVASAAVVDRDDYRQGMAPKAEAWCAGVFTHESYPWISSPNPPFYGLMMFGRFGIGGEAPHVLNNSWNWNHDSALAFDGSTHVTYAADAVALDGAIVVVAANNWTRQPEPPSDGWNVITVGATAPGPEVYDQVADFSNRGPSPSFFAPAAGDVRSTIDILAPGQSTPWGGGTSLASPYVSGGAALVVQKGLARGYSIDPRVIKAVLLNSARPLAGWTNNASLISGIWSTTQPLDYEQGAGQMALDDAYSQYDDPAQRGIVEQTGWDLHTVSEGAPVDYQFRLELRQNTPFVATLVWFMDRDVVGYDPDVADPFAGSSLVDNSFDNLDLELWSADASGNPMDLVAESVSSVDSVEHLRFDIPQTSHYVMRVKWTDEIFDNIGDTNEAPFAVAWSAVFRPELQMLAACPNDFAGAPNGAGGERLSRFGCISAPAPPAVAGGTGTAIRVVFKTLYNTAPGNPDGASVCADRSLLATPQPNLSQFETQTRWLGAPAEVVDEATPTPPNYIAAPLVCTAAEAAVRDWSPAGLAASFGGNADTSRILFHDPGVVPCSVYEVSQCSDPLNEAICSDPVLIFTSRMADAWPPFDVLGQPSFTDINGEVNKYKGIPFSPGAMPQGGPPEWHSLQAGNVFSLPGRLTTFLDISVGVDGYKGLPYREQGPCDPDTATDNCGNPCSAEP